MENPMHYAGLRDRFLALLIDILALGALFFPITRIVKGVWLMSAADHRWVNGLFITDPLCVAFLVAMFLYFALLEGLVGATLGKRLAGLRVVVKGGGRPGLWAGLLRNALRLVDGLPCLSILGVVLILRSPERARVGDRLAGTRVVRVVRRGGVAHDRSV